MASSYTQLSVVYDMWAKETHPVLNERLKPLRLSLLLLVLLDLPRNASAFREVEGSILGGPLLLLLGPLVFCSMFQRAANLVNESCELLGGLRRDGLHVSLEDEKILGFDENVECHKFLVIGDVGDDLVVKPILGGPCGRDSVL